MSTDKRLPYQKPPLFMRALRAKRIPRLCWGRSTSSGNYAKPRPFVTIYTVVRHESILRLRDRVCLANSGRLGTRCDHCQPRLARYYLPLLTKS